MYEIVILLCIVGVFLLAYLLSYGKNKLVMSGTEDVIIAIYDYFRYFMLLNFLIFAFTITNYYYRLSVPGKLGPKGRKGDKGDPGNNQECSVCDKRNPKFVRPPRIPKTLDLVEDKLEDKLEVNEPKKINKKISRWGIYNLENGSGILGDNSDLCKSNKTVVSGKGLLYEKCQDTGIVQAPTYVNGAAVRVDNSGDLYSLQFTANEEVKRGNNYEENTVLLKGNSGRWGGKDRLFKVGEKSNTIPGHNRGKFYEFSCPPGSGIYRIDTVHQPTLKTGSMSGNIKGVKFFCKDVKNGKNVDIKDSKGKLFPSKHFGINPDVSNKKYIYNRAVCDEVKNGKKLAPSFISGVGAIHGDRVNTLKVYNCKYLKKKDSKK